MTYEREYHSCIVACGLASEPRHLPGSVERCLDCNREIFVSDDTRREMGQAGGWVCIDCARHRWDGSPVGLTPFGQAIAEEHGATEVAGMSLKQRRKRRKRGWLRS